VMLKIEAREKLSGEDRHTLAHFVALQILRGPDFHEDMNKLNDALMRRFNEFLFADREIGERLWNKADKKLGGDSGVTFDEAQEFILSGKYSIKTHRNRTLELMLELAPDFANIFLRQEWIVFCAPPTEAFVTCDRPFSIVPPPIEGRCLLRGAGIATRGAIKLMPLSMGRCLGIGAPGDLFGYADSDTSAVRMWNLQVCKGAFRFVIGSGRELVHSLVTQARQAYSERGTEWSEGRFAVG